MLILNGGALGCHSGVDVTFIKRTEAEHEKEGSRARESTKTAEQTRNQDLPTWALFKADKESESGL